MGTAPSTAARVERAPSTAASIVASSTLAAAAPGALRVLVVVPLCDGAQLACGGGALGDPRSLDANVYWGAKYGAERFLRRQPRFAVGAPAPLDDAARASGILRSIDVVRAGAPGERAVHATLVAFDGTRIDDALAFFFDAVRDGAADLVVWSGHDRLMDVAPPPLPPTATRDVDVAVLACDSERFFGPVLAAAGARTVAMTRSFMAPEGYLLAALLDDAARPGPIAAARLRAALVDAYARYQKITPRAAATVFSRLP